MFKNLLAYLCLITETWYLSANIYGLLTQYIPTFVFQPHKNCIGRCPYRPWGYLHYHVCGTIVAIPIILNRLPVNYFQHDLEHKWMEDYHPIFRNIGLVVKNTVGLIFLLAGIAMLVLPGQGILTMVIGVSLLDFPGKRKLEHKLLTQAMVFQAINSIRAKCSKPPFDPPSESTFS